MISETRRRLKEWGKWACGGEPRLASMFRAITGRSPSILGEMPPDIQEIDHLICIAPREIRGILIQIYTRSGSRRDKALALGVPESTLRWRLERAEWHIHAGLDNVAQSVPTPCSSGVSVQTGGLRA